MARRWWAFLLLVGAVAAQETPAFVVAGQTEPPTPGVEITLWDATAAHRVLGKGASARDGAFSIRVSRGAAARREHTFGSVIVVARRKGIAEQREIYPAGWTKCRIPVRRASTIRGIVRDLQDRPLAGEVIVARRVADGEVTVVEATTAGEKGDFLLERFGPCPVRLRISVPGYEPTTELTVEEGELLEFDLVAVEKRAEAVAAPFRGRVVDPMDHPIRDCRVEADPPGHAAWTDADGRYLLSDIPRGMVRLTARHPGYLPATVVVEAGPAADHLTFRLGRGGAVRGHVQTTDLEPVLGARVSVLDGEREIAIGFSNPKGVFRIAGVPERELRIRAESIGLRSVTKRFMGPGEGATTGEPKLRICDRLPLLGRLHSDSGDPLSGVELRCEAGKTTTDEEGRFHFGTVALNGYSIGAEPEGHSPVAVGLWPGEEKLLIAESRLGGCSLEVMTTPNTEGRVTIRRRTVPQVRRTQRLGRPFEHLPAGMYDILVQVEGYMAARGEFDLRGGMNSTIIDLKRSGSLRITASPGANVIVQTLAGRPAPVAVMELAEGSAELRGFGPGRYRFISRAPDELIVFKEIELAPQSPPAEVDLRGREAATLAITVQDAAGDPVQGAEITLVAEGGFEWRVPGRKTNAKGELTLRRLFGGYLELHAREGGREGATGIQIEPGKTLTATVIIR
ncbi:MAG: carboxypeptidase-like regulatory domain-containing protein [Planctomycetota bacterium]|jgi:protocatechuate 3,4-dioxygenase beta subunit